jgi:ribosome biogenesis GTPase
VLTCSAVKNRGIDALKAVLMNKTTVIIGQSGVGKSSLINTLVPGLQLNTGMVSAKYNRGNHTTVFSMLINMGDMGFLIDTPGIREMEVTGISSRELQFLFPEFLDELQRCSYSSCTHTHEPECAVKRKVGEGKIHSDRYESYVRLFTTLENMERYS